MAQNEYGLSAYKVIMGVEILNTGGGLSVDDITNEEQCTFVARTMTPWIPWAGEGAADASVVQGVTGGDDGMFYGTGTPSPSNSTIPDINEDVKEAYKDWAGIDQE